MSPDEERSRALAEELPGDVRVIGLLLPEGSDEADTRAVDGLAVDLARRRGRTLLANLAPRSSLDRRLGAEGEPGVAEVVAGEAALEAAALRPGGRPYLYLRAGAVEFDPRRVLEAGAFGELVRRLRRLEGTLLLALPGPEVSGADLSGLLDGVVPVGAGPGAERAAGVPVLGVLGPRGERGGEVPPREEAPEGEPPRGEAAGDGASDGVEAAAPVPGDGSAPPEGRWRRRVTEAGFPTGKIVGAALLVAALFGGWWFLVRQVGPPPGSGTGEVPEGSATGPAEASSGPPVAAGEPAGEEGAAGDRWAPLLSEAPELPYSVLVASYSSPEDARERLAERAGDGVLYFLAPTPVRGRVYHRFFAGARSERASADSLMRALVREGRKEGASEWDVRPVPFAFRLGVYAESEDGRREVDRLADRGIPAYLVPLGRGQRRAWQVYAGAYESEEAAAPLRRALDSAGEEARLVRRRGVER